MDSHSETLSRLEKLQASLDSLIHELRMIRSEMRLKTKETVTRELLTVLEDVAKIVGPARDTLHPDRISIKSNPSRS